MNSYKQLQNILNTKPKAYLGTVSTSNDSIITVIGNGHTSTLQGDYPVGTSLIIQNNSIICKAAQSSVIFYV